MQLLVPLAVMLYASTFLIPPDVSLPQVIRPAPFLAMQSWITIYSVGLLTRMPSASRPALRQKSSSLQSISQFLTSIHDDESMSMPSVLGPLPSTLLRIVIPSTVTLWE